MAMWLPVPATAMLQEILPACLACCSMVPWLACTCLVCCRRTSLRLACIPSAVSLLVLGPADLNPLLQEVMRAMMCLFLDFWDTQLRHLREVRADGTVSAVPTCSHEQEAGAARFSWSCFCGIAHPGYDFLVLLVALDVAGCAAVAAWCTCRLPLHTLICYLQDVPGLSEDEEAKEHVRMGWCIYLPEGSRICHHRVNT